MNSKMTTNSQLSTNEPKKQKLSKQIEQEQNHRNGDHREGYGCLLYTSDAADDIGQV